MFPAYSAFVGMLCPGKFRPKFLTRKGWRAAKMRQRALEATDLPELDSTLSMAGSTELCLEMTLSRLKLPSS